MTRTLTTAFTSHRSSRRRWLLAGIGLVAAAGGLAGCGGGGDTTPVNLTGTWGDPLTSRYVLALSQSGSNVNGSLQVGTFGNRTSFPLRGSVDGDQFNFTASDGCNVYNAVNGELRHVPRANNGNTLEGTMTLRPCNVSGNRPPPGPITVFMPRQPG